MKEFNTTEPQKIYSFNQGKSVLYEKSYLSGFWHADPSLSGIYPSLPNVNQYLSPGGTSPDGFEDHLAVFGSDGKVYYRKNSVEFTPTVLLNTSRTVRAVHDPGSGQLGPVGCDTDVQFETTAIPVSPGQTGCTNGAVIFAPTNGIYSGSDVYYPNNKAELNCITGAAGADNQCASAVSIPRCNAPGGNIYTYATGFPANSFQQSPPTPSPMSNDTMFALWGVPPNQPRLVSLRQMGTTRTYPDGNGAVGNRGASVLFGSTDCSTTWSYLNMLDACNSSYDILGACQPNQGTDRPQFSYHTSRTLNRAYAISFAPAAQFRNRYPIFHANVGNLSLWTRLRNSNNFTLSVDEVTSSDISSPSRPVVMKDKVFFGFHEVGNVFVFPYDETTQNFPTMATKTNFRVTESDYTGDWQPGFSWINMAPIETNSSGYYLRMVFPKQISGNRQGIRLMSIRATSSSAQWVTSAILQPSSSTGSMLWPTLVTVNEVDDPQSIFSRISLLYWYETDLSDPTGEGSSWGNVTVKGCILRDLEPDCNSFQIAKHNGNASSWNYNYRMGRPGDYHESGGYIASGKIRFLVHYIEPMQSSLGLHDVIRFNIVEVTP